MEVYENRLNSFQRKRTGKGFKWPHPKTWKATPQTLAEAGFYFDPSTDDPDNVTCFMCNKPVTEWAEEDDPFDIHFEKCADTCAWANLKCGWRRDVDSRGRFAFPDKSRLPTSKAMEKARLQTFTAHGWKHDKNKKHGASSKKMAHGGFVYYPAEAGDDTAACLYCPVSLGNWDEDDDPMQQHRDRDQPENPCPFLALAFGSDASSSNPQAKQPKAAKRGTKTKPPTHTDILMPTKTYDGSDDDIPFPASVTKSTAKTPRTVTRSVSKANLRNQPSDEEVTPPPKKRGRSKSVSRSKVSENDVGDDRSPSPLPPIRQRRPTTAARSRSKSVSRPAPVPEAATLFDDDIDEPQAEPQVPRKTARSKSRAPEERTDDEPARKPSRSRSKVVGAAIDIDGEQLDVEAVPRKPSRSKAKPNAEKEEKETKRSSSRSQSKPQPPPDDASSDDGWFVAPLPPPPVRSRTKSVSRPKGKKEETDVDDPPARSRTKSVSRQKGKAETDVDEAAPIRSKTKSVSRPKGKTHETDVDEAPPPTRSRMKSVSRPKGKTHETDVEEDAPAPPVRSRTKSVSRPKAKTHEADAHELDASRKEQKEKQTAETQRPPSRIQSNDLEAAVDPVVRKPSHTKSKPSGEVKKPPSHTKAQPPPSDDEQEMEQYLPPPSSHQEKPQSKLSAKVDGIAEESQAHRGRKPPSRSTSKTVLTKVDSPPAEEAVEEEEIEPAAPPPPRTRTASTRSTSTAPPVSRSVSAAATARTKAKRDPSPESLDADVHMPPEYEQPVVLLRQGSRPVSRAGGHFPSQVVGADTKVSTSRKPESSAPLSPALHAQPRGSKVQKNTPEINDQQEDDSIEETGDGLPVVDISTDDDEPKATKTPAKTKGKGKTLAKGKKPAVEAEAVPSPRRQPTASRVMDDVNDDVEMAEVEQSIQLEPDPLPTTPPRKHSLIESSAVADAPTQWSHEQTSQEGFAFIPPLATDPFVNMTSLSEAEQDMTVEEWIRYQMGIEYERFKRDGERQLGMFELRAEEVRKAIETL